MQVLAI